MVRCITICLVHPGTCWTRCCQLVQCWAPPWCPSVVLFIRGSLSSLRVFQAQCDKLTSRSSDDCSFVLICSRANSGRQASQPFLGYLEVLFLLAGGWIEHLSVSWIFQEAPLKLQNLQAAQEALMMGLFFPIFIVGLVSRVNAGYNVGVGRADITGPAAEVFAIILPGQKRRRKTHFPC